MHKIERNNMRENRDEKEAERKREKQGKHQWNEEACRLEQNGLEKDDTK